jgi:hypothetical protein
VPFGRVTVPFEPHPELYVRAEFGCPVVTGERFTVLTCDGKLHEL